MAGDKYIKVDSNGHLAEQATVNSSLGAGDANKVVALNASGLIDTTMLPENGAIILTSSEAIAAGDLINIHDSSGIKVRKATNTGEATRAQGYAEGAISNGASGTVILGNGMNNGITGLTVGAKYFLGTSGGVTTTAPTAAASIVQPVGAAKSATELSVVLGDVVIRA